MSPPPCCSCSTSFSPLILNRPFFHRAPHHHPPHSLFHFHFLAVLSRFPSHIRLAASTSDSSDHILDDESRWLREERRWLREEQRWLREEQRWNSERESLLREISNLRGKIEAREHRIGSSGPNLGAETMSAAVAAAILQVLKVKEGSVGEVVKEVDRNALIPESASGTKPFVIETKVESVEKQEAAAAAATVVEKGKVKKLEKRKTLRFGAEGDDVRAMQEALLELGFYSGEEDMEFSSFSSGTERAVKTWQASLGANEDGVMTAELLEILYAAQQIEKHGSIINGTQRSSDSISTKEGGAKSNGAVSSSILEIAKVEQTLISKGLNAEVDISKHRVFLLGENRWEDPSRLISNKQPVGTKSKISPTKCIGCRGEGRLLCTECDGTGEANVEPQFLEWVEDGAKCPYCEGLGYNICDLCEG